MPRDRPVSSSAEAPVAVKWEPFLDDSGNLYFYNHVTGESVWELPPDGGEDQDQTPGQSTSKPHGSLVDAGGGGGGTDDTTACSQYSVAVGVVETAVKLVDAVGDLDGDASPGNVTMKKKEKKMTFMSPAAESRRRRNDAKVQTRKQRLHDISAEKYMKLVLPPVSPSAGAEHDEKLEGDAKLRRTGSLFTAQDSEQWQREIEAEHARERRAGRKQRQQHKLRVRSLKQQQIMLLQLRTELTKYLLGEIQCSPELLKQKILLLSSQTPQSALATSRLEPEIVEKLAAAERQAQEERLDAIQAAFELLDSAKCGKIRLISVITGIFAHEYVLLRFAALERLTETNFSSLSMPLTLKSAGPAVLCGGKRPGGAPFIATTTTVHRQLRVYEASRLPSHRARVPRVPLHHRGGLGLLHPHQDGSPRCGERDRRGD